MRFYDWLERKIGEPAHLIMALLVAQVPVLLILVAVILIW